MTSESSTSGMVSGAVSGSQMRDDTSFRNFSIVWAFASLFHMAHSGIFDTRLNLALLTVVALYVIFKPGLSGFIALILLQLVDVFIRMPHVTNHWLFTAFVNITILQAILFCVWKKKSFHVSESELYQVFAPIVRVEVLILYFWATFHKLNSSFFSPEVSCATELLEAQHLDGLIATFPAIVTLNAYFTILIEGGILVMLFLPRTRNAGVFLAFVFHAVISFSSYNAFFDFTSMVVAVYFLFTSNEFHVRVNRWRESVRGNLKTWFTSFSVSRFIITCVAVTVILGAVLIANKYLDTPRLFHLYFFWTIYLLGVLYLLTRFLVVNRSQADPRPAFAFSSKWFLVLPVIVFLNGASPYVGLKTENSFAMFSNLRTEGGITNHYLAPAGLQVFNFQSEVVEIISSTDPGLQRLAQENQLMVLFEFRNYLQKNRPAEVVYLHNGEESVFRYGETEMSGKLSPNPYLLTRLMRFRTVSKNEPQVCAH